MCASPAYLSAHGTPQSPEELSNHDLIVSTGLNPSSDFRFINKGVPQVINAKPRFLVSDNSSAITATVNGVGISNLISYQIAPELVDGSLRIILSEYEPKPVPVHVVHNEGRYAIAKMRALIDFLVEELRADPALD